MNTSSSPSKRLLFLSGALLAVLSLTTLDGCRANRQARAERKAAASGKAPNRPGSIVLDGKFDDWPAGVSTIADADWIYFRVSVEGQNKPLQSSDSTLALWVDADDSPSTGAQMPSPQVAAALGVDLDVEFSPQDGSGHAKPGLVAYAMENGQKVSLTKSQIEVESAPTTAAQAYEIRISRHPDPKAAPTLARLLSSSGQARGMFVLIENGKVVGWSDPEAFTLPPPKGPSSQLDVDPPAKPAGAVRILSFNVMKNSPEKNPGPFVRIFEVTKPDIILLQEWDTNKATAQAWFTAMVTGDAHWNAMIGEGGDVLIVSPYPISPLVPTPVTASGEDKPVRFASAIVKTPVGDVAVGTVHLKCCGTVDSSEEQRRIAEATAVQTALTSTLGADNAKLRVIGGDLNLVGSTAPLDKLAAGLDFDGSELAAADPYLLGDDAQFTWTDDADKFPPGRLDYVLYSDSKAHVVDCFVLDTRRLGPRSLARMGLDRTDSAASDHLPVIVDIKPH
jgi:endonuclease/exonuclease/phosphatase family metal-dependent hydrolase